MKNIKYYLIISILLLTVGLILGWYWHKSSVEPIIVQLPPQIITQTQYLPSDTITITNTVYKDTVSIVYKEKLVYVYAIIDTTFNNSYTYDSLLTQDSGAKLSFNVQTIDSIGVYIDTLYNQSFLRYNQNVRLVNFLYQPKLITTTPNEYLLKKIQLFSDFNIIINNSQQITDNKIKQVTQYTPSIGLNLMYKQKYKFNLGLQTNGFMVGVGMKLWEIK